MPAEKQTSVDVVVYTFNHESFIEKALVSVFEQEVDFPVTIRVHDDCSTDSTGTVLARLARESPFPMHIERPAKNRYKDGSLFKHEFLAASRGDFVAILDGDDFWCDSTKLKKQHLFMRDNKAVSLSHHAYEIQHQSGKSEVVRQETSTLRAGTDFAFGNFVGTSSVMLRRSFIPNPMPDGFQKVRGVDDWPIWALTTQNSMVGYLDDIMSVYRLHDDNHFANQELQKKRYQSLLALAYILNSVDEVHQSLWMDALEVKIKKKTSIMGQLVTLKNSILK